MTASPTALDGAAGAVVVGLGGSVVAGAVVEVLVVGAGLGVVGVGRGVVVGVDLGAAGVGRGVVVECGGATVVVGARRGTVGTGRRALVAGAGGWVGLGAGAGTVVGVARGAVVVGGAVVGGAAVVLDAAVAASRSLEEPARDAGRAVALRAGGRADALGVGGGVLDWPVRAGVRGAAATEDVGVLAAVVLAVVEVPPSVLNGEPAATPGRLSCAGFVWKLRIPATLATVAAMTMGARLTVSPRS